MIKNTLKKRVAIYIRVSTLDQAERGYSLDAQEKALRKWCEDHGHEVFFLYADRGISAKDILHRPEMRHLLEDAKRHKFDIVIFWALSRFTRSVQDLYFTMENFKKLGIDMISYTESFDTSSPMGRAMVGMLGIFAQLERELTGERVAAALRERAEQGKRTCSEVLGYDLAGKDSFTINQKEAEYVRFCFDYYIKKQNLTRVAEEAKRLGYRGKRGKAPTAWSIQKILMSPIYCGFNSFAGKLYTGGYEPIIDIKTYSLTQALLIQHGKKSIDSKRLEVLQLFSDSASR